MRGEIKTNLKSIEIEAEIKRFGSAGHLILPKMFVGKKVLIKIKEIKENEKE